MKIALKKLWAIQSSILKMRKARLEGKNHFLMVLLLTKIGHYLEAATDSQKEIYRKYASDQEVATGILKPDNPMIGMVDKEFGEVLNQEVTIHDHETINLSLEDAAEIEIGVLQDFDPFIDLDGMKQAPEGASDAPKKP